MNFLPRANSEAGTSNDAAPASGSEYQVFLSFRGLDTRHGFTDFLYNDLSDVGVRVFRDDDELHVGELISDNLLSAINNSIIYIPIFSQTYASSKWCLWELAHIVDNVSKSKDEKCIFPIFLDVEPDDVKLKTRIYSDALLEHERKFPNEVEAWRAALAAVGKIKGLNVTSSQAAIVKLVVEEVLKKLKIKQKSVTEYLVGFDDRIKELTEFLDVNHDDVRLIGIYGMGGIGKTTIAKVVFNKLCSHFGKRCSFLDDVRERSNKEGIVSLQKQLLVDIGGSGTLGDINNSEQGMRRIRETLSNKKVLVVLDDVDKRELISNLIGNSKLYPGSRIIITTRNTSVLEVVEVEGFEGETQQYEMLKMDAGPALQLFSRHAFSGDFHSNDYRWLSSDIVSTTGGLPLAIQVIGSLLKGKRQEIWEETLGKLRNVPAKEILNKLRISYDDLEERQKQIFLDIACFFVNKNKTDAIYMWTDCQFYPQEGIQVLIDRCLIKILDNDKLWMHDQLIALGRQIVREDSPNDLEKHSRLWIAKEALQIIGTEKKKCKVQALEISTDGSPIEIRNEDFKMLPDLRFLDLKRGTYVGDFAKCHSNLRWFSWSNPWFSGGSWYKQTRFGFFTQENKLTLDFRASNLYLDKLVVCKLHGHDFKDDSKAWDLIKRAENLKVLTITWCSGITTIPNISRCSALERLTLVRCSSLKRIESSIGDLQSLIELKIIDCSNLIDLPKEVGALVKLKCFSLQYCERLRELPDSLGNLTSLTELDLSGTIIMELPNFILQLKSLEILRFPLWPFNVNKCYDHQLTCGISTLLTYPSQPQEIVLGHSDSKPPVQLPSSNWRWRNLSTLEFYCCEVQDISLDGLSQLENLRVFGCKRLQRLSIPLELRKLQQVMVESCRDLIEIQFVDVSKSLEGLTVVDGKSLTINSGLSYLKNLERLEIKFCDVLTNVEGLNELESLKALSVYWCMSLRWLIDASCTKIPDDCIVNIQMCGYFIKDSIKHPMSMEGTPLKHYKKEILQNTSKKDSFTIRFHLGVKKPREVWFRSVCGIEREKEGVDPDSVTYEGLIADVKSFGFRFKRMWYETKGTHIMQMQIGSDACVNEMLDRACMQGFIIHLYVEGGVDSEWEGEYDEEMMKMLREERRMKTDVYSNEDGAKGDVSCPNEDSNSAPVGDEGETHGNSSVDDSQLGRGNAECFEATTSIAEDLDSVKKQVELHEKPRDEETITLEHYGEEIFLNTLNKV
ncbi:disease resistance protein RUN1-like [Eucalyptus grandis]|uniref:disease resistance protein RUN1-like n=1 Tax=Eucalyptus grandis TaxID=71139 RepID=UPI00192EDAC8|nr:disease resistance protein RUN1-like [Eucalyptus grandis]